MTTQVTLRFAPEADMVKGRRSLSAAPGVTRVEQVFPACDGGEADDELERLHVAEVEDDLVGAFLSYCAISFDVEQAHKSAPRRLMTPAEAT